jgi:hypothetical protein
MAIREVDADDDSFMIVIVAIVVGPEFSVLPSKTKMSVFSCDVA